MNHHQIEKTAASMTIEIRNAAAINLNHSQYDTHPSSSRRYCRVSIIEQPRMHPIVMNSDGGRLLAGIALAFASLGLDDRFIAQIGFDHPSDIFEFCIGRHHVENSHQIPP